MPATHEILVIPTTHWDRAWYWPFERFRIRLIQMWEAVIEMWQRDPDYRFNADGQAVCVEDYLEVFPEHRELFARMGREGRLGIGALYCQSDLYCTGGEALIRNVLHGSEIARQLNAFQPIIYMPDTFGHVPSIPMISQGFGFPVYTFMRGLPKKVPHEDRFWIWESADGSSIVVFRMRDGYANGARLGLHRGTGEIMDKKSSGIKPSFKMPMAVEQITSAATKQADAMGPPHVLNAGVDHQIPQRQLSDIMREAESDEHHFRYADWAEVIDQISKKDTSCWFRYRGELHGEGGAATVLGGTVSARVYLKQRNADCERQLIQIAEPADAAVGLLAEVDSAGRVLHNTWKRLLKCQPHDNITGCSVDAVHREDEQNFACVEQATDAITRQMSKRLVEIHGGQAEDDFRYAFFLYNTQIQPVTRNVILTIDHEGRFNFGDMPVHNAYDIVDETGRAIPFRELSRDRGVEHPHPVVVLEMQVHLEPFTFHRFFFEPRDDWRKTAVESVLENEHLHCSVNANGSVDLTDKESGATWQEACLFSDQADLGDEYDFSHIENDAELVFRDLRLRPTAQHGNNGMQVVELEGMLEIPASSDENARSGDRAALPVRLSYILCPGQRQLDLRIRFTNTVSDHRLRLNIPLPSMPTSSRAGLKFEEVERPSSRAYIKEKNEKQYTIHPIYPTNHYVAAENDSGNGLAVFSEFPCNYEVVHDDNPRLAVTLLRAVGMLSRGSLTRGPGAGPDTRTPEAQCLGRSFEMRFGLRPFSASRKGGLFAEAFRWRWQPVFGLIHGFDPALKPAQPAPLFRVDNPTILLSTFKRSMDSAGQVLRLWNPSATRQTGTLRSQAVARFERTDLHENTIVQEKSQSDGEFHFAIEAFGLLTLLCIEPDSRRAI